MSETALSAGEFTAELRGLSELHWGGLPFHARLCEAVAALSFTCGVLWSMLDALAAGDRP